MWIAKGYPTVSGPQPTVSAAVYKANFQPELYRTMDQIKENLTTKREQVCSSIATYCSYALCYYFVLLREKFKGIYAEKKI